MLIRISTAIAMKEKFYLYSLSIKNRVIREKIFPLIIKYEINRPDVIYNNSECNKHARKL